MLLATALLIIGLLLVVYSADRLVYAASILCRMLGIPPLIIGMTVVSIGTSLPEIMVATTACCTGRPIWRSAPRSDLISPISY